MIQSELGASIDFNKLTFSHPELFISEIHQKKQHFEQISVKLLQNKKCCFTHAFLLQVI